jgi:hypothetical protein
MTHKRTLARLTAGLLLVAGTALGAAAPASAADTGWNGTKIIKNKPGTIKMNADTGWNGT